MAALQIKNFPDDLMHLLKVQASVEGKTLSKLVTETLYDYCDAAIPPSQRRQIKRQTTLTRGN